MSDEMTPEQAKKILAKVQKSEGDKARVTLYLDKARYKELRQLVKAGSLSQLVDELIREFVESAKRK